MKIYIELVLLLFFVAQTGDAGQLFVGVAEETPEKKMYEEAVVRILLAKSEKEWVVLNSQEASRAYNLYEVAWYLAFDGRYLGQLVSVDNFDSPNKEYDNWTYRRDKRYRIKDMNDYPLLGNMESRFGGWRETPKNRPIAIVSKPNYKDPETWKRYNAEATELKLLFPHVKDKIFQAYHCNGAPDWDQTKIHISETDVSIYRSYKNKKGQRLIAIGMSQDHIKNCGGPMPEDHYPMWFFIDSDDKVKFVGYELDLVNAADYDSDGEVEFIFWYGSYNRDGYTLFESNFSERYDYYWSYH